MLGFYVKDAAAIAQGNKTLIVTPTPREDLTGPRILIVKVGDLALATGILVLDPQTAIATKDFDSLAPQHQIGKSERLRWWPHHTKFFGHSVAAYYPLSTPQTLPFTAGVNMNVDFPLTVTVVEKQALADGYKYTVSIKIKES